MGTDGTDGLVYVGSEILVSSVMDYEIIPPQKGESRHEPTMGSGGDMLGICYYLSWELDTDPITTPF